ncbi:hypothetical protein [Streptomyces sp. NPDC051219]|uniref:hypothetical protein n=1 Tax=Streptomyces sp. NPDC051219 TaxID=3155283 RepID=UPI003439742A
MALVAGGSPAVALSADTAQQAASSSGAGESPSALAAASGEPVEVVAERTEYTQTMANPDGTFTLTQSTTPQRVRADDGSWESVDATLERRVDGTVGPKAAVVHLAFSGGGSGKDLIRLSNDRGALTLGWPGQLPQPQLNGDTATYPEVLEGVDLKLTATAEGFREVLVVKSAAAAANPALEEIKLAAAGDGLRIEPGAGGGIRAVDGDGNTVFKGPAGLMWDSAGSTASGERASRTLRSLPPAQAQTAEEPPVDESARPGDGDASSILPVKVEEGAVTVEPDLELLRGEETVYPVFIDPPMGAGHSERTVLSSDGDRFWAFDGDYGLGKCGSADGYYCGNGYVNRILFEFAPTKLTGKKIIDATFRAYETWSFNCTAHWVDLKRTNNISEGTRWPGPSVLDHIGDTNISAGRGDNCSPSQPDSWVEFNDSSAETDENLSSTVQTFADGGIARLTLMLKAKDETDPRA